jgi:hypothetical protein
MLRSKASVTIHEWQFAQKTFTKRSDNMHHYICVKMMDALFQIQIITCAN